MSHLSEAVKVHTRAFAGSVDNAFDRYWAQVVETPNHNLDRFLTPFEQLLYRVWKAARVSRALSEVKSSFNELVKQAWKPAPPGWYLSKITNAEPLVRKWTMIHLMVEIVSPSRYAGQLAHDYIVTSGNAAPGAAIFGKQKLRGLGFTSRDFARSIDDRLICRRLLGKELFVKYGNEPMKTIDPSGRLQGLRVLAYAPQNLFGSIKKSERLNR